MPELPEVETIKNQMERALKGKKISGVEVHYAGRLNVTKKVFIDSIVGSRFKKFERRAKLLLIHLSNGFSIVVHLKMTGSFLLVKQKEKPGKHVHVIFELSGGDRLFFKDIRKFGFMKLIKTSELDEKVFDKQNYGPEPLDPSFTFKKFKMCVTGRPNKKIKPLLMDQTCIAGIGNIYADESLWYAKVMPDRAVSSLKETELKGVYQGAIRSLKASIKRRGTSSDNYLDLYGKKGTNVSYLKVYGRGGQECKRCGSDIKKVKMNQRGTHFCPKCQK